MKRRLICILLTLALTLMICAPALAATVTPMVLSGGGSSIDNSGRNVLYGGFSRSSTIEDVISVSLSLMEYRNGAWYTVDTTYRSLASTNYVATSDSCTVTGGTYYKTKGTHVAITNGVSTTIYSQSPTIWID